MSNVVSTDPNSPDFMKPVSGSTLDGGGATGTGVTDDYTGAARPSPPSIGAFEAAGSSPSGLTAGAESAYLVGGMQKQTSQLRISKW